MTFDPGLAIQVTDQPLGIAFGHGVFGPTPEARSLDSIRATLLDPGCTGPDPVYLIAMDVGVEAHREEIQRRGLLFGVVVYAAGRLGQEPVRSQGHVHRISRLSGWSPPEIYEIWRGRAFVLMQERVSDDSGRCFAIEAGPGDVVIVPPGWAHATISADAREPLAFGAWCDRDYGFEYDALRARGGPAFFPVLDAGGRLRWRSNPHYQPVHLTIRRPRSYREWGVVPGESIYRTFARDPDAFQWVSDPGRREAAWSAFEP